MLRPLFNRLTDPGTSEELSSKTVYLNSVREDIGRLLTSRHTKLAAPGKSIVNFGIPNIVGYSNDSQCEKNHLARIIKEAIEEFEPRLSDISVELVDKENWQRATCLITANIEFEEETEQFSFSTNLS